MPIIDLLHRADTHRGVHLGEAISKRAHALVAAGVTTAFDLLDLKSRLVEGLGCLVVECRSLKERAHVGGGSFHFRMLSFLCQPALS